MTDYRELEWVEKEWAQKMESEEEEHLLATINDLTTIQDLQKLGVEFPKEVWDLDSIDETMRQEMLNDSNKERYRNNFKIIRSNLELSTRLKSELVDILAFYETNSNHKN